MLKSPIASFFSLRFFWQQKFLKGGEFAGIMFEDGTTKLVPILEDAATYGGDLFGAFEGLDELNEETCSDLCGDISSDNDVTVVDVSGT